jgi:hypothetical protein
MSKEFDEFITLAKKDFKGALDYSLSSDNSPLAKEIYKKLFEFYEDEKYSGDLIFSWKSASLVKYGDYIGRREGTVDNKRVIGNIFPNFLSDRKFSLNLNRNGHFGDFPHDYFDIYLDHVAKYAYNIDCANIKEYFPLKRAILGEKNQEYFQQFDSFEVFLEKNYFEEIWDFMEDKSFSDMEFDDFKNVSTDLMRIRGERMLNILITQSSEK